jgi:hypothetical protein
MKGWLFPLVVITQFQVYLYCGHGLRNEHVYNMQNIKKAGSSSMVVPKILNNGLIPFLG